MYQMKNLLFLNVRLWCWFPDLSLLRRAKGSGTMFYSFFLQVEFPVSEEKRLFLAQLFAS